MVVNLFLTHLLLEVASPITFSPSPFYCQLSLKSKGLHWWRRSKSYKLYMELHYNPSNLIAKVLMSRNRMFVLIFKIILQNISRCATMMHLGFGIFDLGISTLEDWSFSPRRKWWKYYRALVISIKCAKDVYLENNSRKAFQRSLA